MDINKLYEILLSDKPSLEIKKHEEELFEFIPELKVCKGFDQNNPWHIYDVYEHTLLVIDDVPSEIKVRLAALFHDIGKPLSYKEDEHGIGHFHGHWEESQRIFEEFADKYNVDENIKYISSNLIFYHDLNLGKLSDEELDKVFNIFSKENIDLLFDLKRADLYAHAEKYHSYIENIKKQEERTLSRCR